MNDLFFFEIQLQFIHMSIVLQENLLDLKITQKLTVSDQKQKGREYTIGKIRNCFSLLFLIRVINKFTSVFFLI